MQLNRIENGASGIGSQTLDKAITILKLDALDAYKRAGLLPESVVESDHERFQDLADIARRVDQSGKTIDQLLDISFCLLHLPRQTRNDFQIMADALFKKYAAKDIAAAIKVADPEVERPTSQPTRTKQPRTPTRKIQSPRREQDDIDRAIDAALTFGGQPVTPENRRIVREMFEQEDREKELNGNQNGLPDQQTEKTGE